MIEQKTTISYSSAGRSETIRAVTRNFEAIAGSIKCATDLWELHRTLIEFETALKNIVYEDGSPAYDDHDTESILKMYGVDICELRTFGGENVSQEAVWSWDKDHILVGIGPFKDWEIRERD